MIDWGRVESLRAELGNDDFGEVVDLFLEEVEEVIARLKRKPDPASYEEDLHFLKGGALNLGFRALSDACHEGERRAADGRPETVDINLVIELYQKSRISFLQGSKDARRRSAG
ncbi:MAG: Hpt domain-containing protein [Gemmobacter sp.]|nr:Hpt domain-containing protein [Gemmobacter sp.]